MVVSRRAAGTLGTCWPDASGMGYEIGEHPAFGGVQPVHSANSAHYSGRFRDVNDDTFAWR